MITRRMHVDDIDKILDWWGRPRWTKDFASEQHYVTVYHIDYRNTLYILHVNHLTGQCTLHENVPENELAEIIEATIQAATIGAT